jgi:hypothetical protein
MGVFRIGELAALTGILVAGSAAAGVRIHMMEGHPVVDGVYVNGHGPYRFLVDTGTTLNHLEPALAASIGLKPTFRTELITSSGSTLAAGVDGVLIAVDSLRASGQTFLFAGFDAIHQMCPEVRGILGQAFLSQFDYLLDVKGKRLEFGPREVEPEKTRVPFQTVTGRPMVPTSLGKLVLDSGANWLTLFGVKAVEISREMMTLTGSMHVGMVASRLSIEGRTFWRGKAVAIPRESDSGAAGLLPVSLFKSVYVSNSERYVVFD